ncbi:PTS lactose/cellobiose transporter subunit IIA [Anaerorhabdus sp.]|uniref:PTS lactose/cellobiose transporter subunit IIA n=1 Tax=Anaerorhabdus sp. TaxID=1872524 RepID=UPI002B216F70|nr:PTS lactose/cellobiose transporter subunit IIA [Anaerorhabdus sp.]MEA4874276.1 PTS lactose/cellobiose transporter subunit IIA [Anaerorhabdus sp.]
MEDMMQIAMGLIMHAGNARSLAMEAIQAAKAGQIDQADELIAKSDEALLEAHQVQTNLLVKEARGEKLEIGILLIHSQDHLMTSITVKDLAKEFIDLYREKKS